MTSARVTFRDDSIVEWIGREIHFRNGSGRRARAEMVQAHSGSTAKSIRALPGMLPSTLGNLFRAGLVRIDGVSL